MALTWTESINDGGKINAAFIIELRNNINVERARRSLSAYTFTQPVAQGNKITASSIAELKTAIVGIKTCTLSNVGLFNDNSLL